MTAENSQGAGLGQRALAKASWRILPLLAIAYCLSYMDRVNIGFAAKSLNRDLHFSATIYGLGAGLFFLSYALFEPPSSLLMARVGPRRWLARIMVTWGLIAAAMMFIRTPWQFYGLRFLLGAAEASFFPAVIHYVSLWFPAEFRGRAITRFYIAFPISVMIMGAVAAPLLALEGRLGLAGWQWLFLVEGLPAALMGVVFLFFLPDTPEGAAWLSPAERDWIRDRLQADRQSAARLPEQSFWALFRNPFVLAFGVVGILGIGATNTFVLSMPTVLAERTHLGAPAVGLLITTGGLLTLIGMLLAGWHSDLRQERFLHYAIPFFGKALAFVGIAFLRDPWLFMAAFLFAEFGTGLVTGAQQLVPSDVLSARSIGLGVAFINGIAQVGPFLGPIAWGYARDATGSYQVGLMALPVAYLLAGLVVLWARDQHRQRLLRLKVTVAT